MDAEKLRALQNPIKTAYKEKPESAVFRLHAKGVIGDENVTCKVQTGRLAAEAGLHPAAGGPGTFLCSGDMLLESLVACSGVTLKAVATSLGIPVEHGLVFAEGDLDFKGTLGVSKESPVGFTEIRLRFELTCPKATEEQVALLLKLTDRYCVVLQSLKGPVKSSIVRIDPTSSQ